MDKDIADSLFSDDIDADLAVGYNVQEDAGLRKRKWQGTFIQKLLVDMKNKKLVILEFPCGGGKLAHCTALFKHMKE